MSSNMPVDVALRHYSKIVRSREVIKWRRRLCAIAYYTVDERASSTLTDSGNY